MFSLSALVALLAACAPSPDSMTITQGSVGDDFKPYVAQYEQYKGAKMNQGISITFGDTGPNAQTAGICRIQSNVRTIIVNKRYWDKFYESTRLELILHELGHCDLNRPHNDKLVDGRAVSIMNSYLFVLTPEYFNAYIAELFSPTASDTLKDGDILN